MKEMYEGTLYAENNPTWHEEDSPWKAKQVRGIIEDNKIPRNTICEVGCGTGEILLNLERSFPEARLFGYEISPHAFERAEAKETDRTKFYFEDLAETPEADREFFDVLLVIDVIEHVEDYISFVRKLKPLARYKIFHIPLDLSAQSIIRSLADIEAASGCRPHPLFLQGIRARRVARLRVPDRRPPLYRQPPRTAEAGMVEPGHEPSAAAALFDQSRRHGPPSRRLLTACPG